MPATSRNASELPTVATGTRSVIEKVTKLPAGTASEDVLSDTECAEPAWFVTATSNDAGDEPLF